MYLAGTQAANIDEMVQKFAIWVIPLLLGITLHEFGHAWAAWKLGDPTAKSMGRVSLDPARHIDPVGTVLIPSLMILLQSPILFGWAKPVPINYRRLRDYRWGVALVAFAGPAANLLMMIMWALLFKLVAAQYNSIPQSEFFIQVAIVGVSFNAMLFVLNMLPIPPLDGGRITAELLPYQYAQSYEKIEPYGMFIVLAVLYLFNGQIFMSIFAPFHNFVLSQI